MKIAVLGAGAMGAMIGAYLKKGGAQVFFVDPYEAHMQAVSEHGLYMEIEGCDPETVYMDGATTNAEEVGVCDVVILLVKGMKTVSSIESNKALFGRDTVIITLQNGLGNVDLIKEFFPDDNIGYGILKSSATLYAPGKIYGRSIFEGSPAGVFFYPVTKDTPYFQYYSDLVDIFVAGGFIPKLEEQIDEIIWDKLYSNVAFNCPCALIQISHCDFIYHPMGKIIFREICDEVCAIATAKGIPMDADYYWEHHGEPLIPTGPVTERYYTSAVHDVSRKHKTEVDFLNGAIYYEGQKLGIPTPYNEMIWRLTRILEDTYDVKYTPET